MDDKERKTRIIKERRIMKVFFIPLYFLYWLLYEIPWQISSRSRLKMTKVTSLNQVEFGRIYYSRCTPMNLSGFEAYFPNEDEEYDLCEASLNDATLSGKTNYQFVSVKAAKEHNWPYDEDSFSIEDSFRKKENIVYPEFDDSDKYTEWIKENITEEYQIVFANCGKENFTASFDGVTNRGYLKMIIEERGALYKLNDIKMIKKLERYGLYDSLKKWEESWKRGEQDHAEL